jgi:hypothetical protein
LSELEQLANLPKLLLRIPIEKMLRALMFGTYVFWPVPRRMCLQGLSLFAAELRAECDEEDLVRLY